MYTMDGEDIFSDTQVATIRMVLAGLVLLPFALRAIKKIQKKREVFFLFVVGFFGSFCPSYLFTYAETGISSGYAGMLNSCTPIFTVLMGYFVYKVRLTSVQIIGIVIGTIGLVLLMMAGKLEENEGGLIHISAIVLATLMYAVSMTTIKHHLQQFKAFEITSLSFMLALVPAIAAYFLDDTTEVFFSNPYALEGFSYIAILGVIGTAFAVIIFNQIITLRDPLFASSVTYFIPIIAVFIGFLFSESLNLAQIASMFIVLIGVFFANYWPTLRGKMEGKGKKAVVS
jgi:drug/metabolite transporter (DMT)-like permease